MDGNARYEMNDQAYYHHEVSPGSGTDGLPRVSLPVTNARALEQPRGRVYDDSDSTESPTGIWLRLRECSVEDNQHTASDDGQLAESELESYLVDPDTALPSIETGDRPCTHNHSMLDEETFRAIYAQAVTESPPRTKSPAVQYPVFTAPDLGTMIYAPIPQYPSSWQNQSFGSGHSTTQYQPPLQYRPTQYQAPMQYPTHAHHQSSTYQRPSAQQQPYMQQRPSMRQQGSPRQQHSARVSMGQQNPSHSQPEVRPGLHRLLPTLSDRRPHRSSRRLTPYPSLNMCAMPDECGAFSGHGPRRFKGNPVNYDHHNCYERGCLPARCPELKSGYAGSSQPILQDQVPLRYLDYRPQIEQRAALPDPTRYADYRHVEPTVALPDLLDCYDHCDHRPVDEPADLPALLRYPDYRPVELAVASPNLLSYSDHQPVHQREALPAQYGLPAQSMVNFGSPASKTISLSEDDSPKTDKPFGLSKLLQGC